MGGDGGVAGRGSAWRPARAVVRVAGGVAGVATGGSGTGTTVRAASPVGLPELSDDGDASAPEGVAIGTERGGVSGVSPSPVRSMADPRAATNASMERANAIL